MKEISGGAREATQHLPNHGVGTSGRGDSNQRVHGAGRLWVAARTVLSDY